MKTPPIKSAERALELFELFSASEMPLTVGEVSRGLNIPRSSSSTLLHKLTEMAYLEYLPSLRRFRPTIRILLLGDWMRSRHPELDSLVHAANTLYQTVNEPMTIGMQNGTRLQILLSRGASALSYIDKPSSLTAKNTFDGGDHALIQSGLTGPLTSTAIGQVVLSQKSDSEIIAIVRRTNAEEKECASLDEACFMEKVREIRENGYAEIRGEAPRLAVLAVGVPLISGPPVGAAVVLLGGKVDKRREFVLDALRQFQRAGQPHAQV